MPPITTAQRTYQIGNSLTDVRNDWVEPVAKQTGFEHQYRRLTILGAIAWETVRDYRCTRLR